MKDILKFITCGSVDDGKSTLIGHMLYDAKLLYTDQKNALLLESKLGSNEGKLDYSLLLDGLLAEREQGITIDVAYRFFSTNERTFIVADCPGHEQYTRNMAVGASFADLAVILVDATQGILTQTKRHTKICLLMGIKHIVLAVNKMDRVAYDPEVFNTIVQIYQEFLGNETVDSFQAIPVSATLGDNVNENSPNTLWYKGKALLPYLESIEVQQKQYNGNFILPIQRVSRPHSQFRGFQGQIESGSIVIGDAIQVLPSYESAVVKEIWVGDQKAETASVGQPVTLQLDREIDISRGNVIVSNAQVETTDLFTAKLLWMDEQELMVGRNYLIKCGTKLVPGTIIALKYKVDIHSNQHLQDNKVGKNDLAMCDIAMAEKIAVTPFEKTKGLGSFILIDRVTHATTACGTIEHTLRRSNNVVWQNLEITREIRAGQKNQMPLTIWFTGLSGSGKSTLANALEKKLVSLGKHTILLDGDNIRHGLNKNLGFKEVDRVENIRRIAEVAHLMNDAGLITLVAFVSPYEEDRINAKNIIGSCFFEVYVSTTLEVCESRDVKGLYQKARNGEIPNFTGISSPYEVPIAPDMVIDTEKITIDEAIDKILSGIEKQMEM